VGELSERRESMVLAAWNSWKKPTTMLSMMTAATTPPSIQDWIPKEAAMARMSTYKSANQ
jgi:hypothetical protein